jgi:RNA polymerase sigma-70 factor (ECF subfamily)
MDSTVERLAFGSVDVSLEREREFEARLRDSSTLAFRVAFSVVRHRQDAEDIAQEAFTRAYRRFHQLRDRSRFRAWLVRTTWRLAMDAVRASRRRTSREQFSVAGAPPETPGEQLESKERAVQVWRAIDRLPDKLRIVVVLASLQEHDLDEVSRLLGIPVGTVKSRLFLARQQLRETLQCVMSPR